MLEQLGKYRIDSILGKGAMGVVYKGFDPYIERVVALKTIRKELFSDVQQAELISRFKNEAQAAGRLQHPNIVTVYDYGEDNESAYIAMEFVDGTALDTLMVPAMPTALARIGAWMSDLLLALDYAHSRGVIHRDIKPANLLITTTARVKVSDFGIARIESSTLTQTGAMIGTPSYMSPEQFRGDTVDGRSDVFSAGVVLYQLLTGVRPFVGSPAIVMQQILNDMPAAPSRVLPSLGTGYDRLLERALAKAQAERFPSARAFLEALSKVGQADCADPDASAMADPDRTVMAGGLRIDRVPPAGSVTGGAISTNSGTNSATMAPWKLAALPELEVILSRQIGPMAKFLLKSAAAKADGIDALCEVLLPHIPSERGRQNFQDGIALVKRKLAASGTGSGTSSSRTALGGAGISVATGIGAGAGSSAGRSTIRAPVAFDDAFVDSTAHKLTVFIGPIAKLVAKRAARQTNDRNDFLRLVAEHIDTLAQRARFLAESGAA